jgi:predicted transcriptional regulator
MQLKNCIASHKKTYYTGGMEKFIESLKARRGKWKALAHLAGIDYSTITRIVRRKVSPRMDTVEKLQACFSRIRP